MKLSIALLVSAIGYIPIAKADGITPASPEAELKAAEKNQDAEPKIPDAGSTMTQQRMEDDSNDGRSRDAKIRARQDIKLYDSKPSRRP